MSVILNNFVLILFIIYFYRTNRHGLHILQLEHYYTDRYVKWMQKNSKNIFNVKKIGMLIISSIVLGLGFNKIGYALTIITYLVLIFTLKKRKEKKPFVITARVKRQFITYIIIILILIGIVNVFNDIYSIVVLNLFAAISYIFVYVVAIINKPIEKLINNRFCKKAKLKLNSIPECKVVGITGSYGKTSTKYIVDTILSQKYNTLMTPESYNTTMGVVRTINEKLKSTNNLFICEMGAKYRGDVKEICDIVEPDFAIITAVGPQHLDTFKTIENVSKTKFELVDSLKDDGIAFLNWEDENIRKVKTDKKVVKYGLNKKADYYAENIEITERGSSFDVIMPNKNRISVKTKLLGKLNILNIVCGVAVGDKLGLTEEQIKIGIKFIKPVEHRLELRQNPNGSIIIDDAYNSNVKGAEMALEVLGSFKERKRILITPGIVDLGKKSFEINKQLGKTVAKYSDYIILVGEKQAAPIAVGIKEAKFSKDKVMIAKDLDEAIKKMNEIIDSNSVVLLENDLPDNYL